MMQKQLAELVDISRLQRLMDTLYEVAGIPSAILDRDLTVLTATGWQDICTKFHRVHPETLQKCKESDNYLGENLHLNSYIGYRCKNGMVDYACSIVIKEEHVATLIIGQFFLEPPSEKFFRQQARTYGFNEEEYIRALRKIPIIEKERVEIIIAFFVELAQLIADMGLRSINHLEMVEFLKDLMNAIPNPIFYKDINGIYQGCNKAFEEFHGIPQNKVIGSSVYDLSPRELAVKYEAMDAELFHDAQVQVYEYQATNAHGEKREIIFNKAPYLNLEKQVAGLVGVMVDITEKDELEVALKNSEAKYRTLFDNLSDGLVYFKSILDDNGSIVDYQVIEANAAFEKLVGLNNSALVGKILSETIFSSPHIKADLRNTFNDVANSGQAKKLEYFSILLKKWLLLSAYSSQPGYYAVVVSDITQQKEKIEQAQYYACHDPLTGLPNRRLFDDRLSMIIAQEKRKKGIIAVIFLDLDKFKEVNDTLGHEVGDILLKEVAQRLLSCIREGDTASRLGGDEFVLIIPNLKDYNEADLITNRILEKCRQTFHINGHVIEISASIGVSFFPNDGDDVPTLTRNADMAMYLCKEQGRNGVCYLNKDSSWSST